MGFFDEVDSSLMVVDCSCAVESVDTEAGEKDSPSTVFEGLSGGSCHFIHGRTEFVGRGWGDDGDVFARGVADDEMGVVGGEIGVSFKEWERLVGNT